MTSSLWGGGFCRPPAALPGPLCPPHSHAAPLHLLGLSRPCSSPWDLPVLCSLQFKNVFSSVWFSHCFVYAILVSIPGDRVHRALHCLPTPRSVGLRETVEGQSWHRSGNRRATPNSNDHTVGRHKSPLQGSCLKA